ncbi:OmpA family protein [Algihabitans albus]|uniref:OmpA family protein n=1 Tax=Algihabitans albus TaxID=2164067 RepID=UPI000E5D0410|nr:OmpA family protein [Algihabitans albus]
MQVVRGIKRVRDASGPKSASRGCRLAFVVVATPLLLSGCGVWGEFFGDEPQPTRVQVPAESAEAETPSLGSIPERRGTSPTTQRQALQQSLTADREQAGLMEADQGRQAVSTSPAPSNVPSAAPSTAPRPPAGTADGLPPAPPGRAGFDQEPDSISQAPQMTAVPQMQQQAPLRRELVGVIYFAHGSANLDSRDRTVLNQVRDILRSTGGQLRVVGHASMRTSVMDPARHALANIEISQQRAAAVANALNRQGVPDSALAIEAMGAQQPVFYEFMPTGEAGNRRVEIYLEY